MIELYTFSTPNGRKASVMLEEVGLPYNVHAINIAKGEQLKPEYLAVNPNNKIPAIVDPDGPEGKPLTLFESGAILIYLAEKTGRLLPKSATARYHALQWLMFQMGGVGPMFGQLNHFAKYAKEKVPYAIERYSVETSRLLKVMDGELGKREYLAGEYSVADVATYPWVDSAANLFPELYAPHTHVHRWHGVIAARPAVQRGMRVPAPG
ncbi:MAG TPA: glutathione S-transferase N-terminal domain-containing protein [Myxococcaceae bacterium]|nr:glutathione S-transferase N-terminal domain-containing protein [Myxococcaceae bacterium]